MLRQSPFLLDLSPTTLIHMVSHVLPPFLIGPEAPNTTSSPRLDPEMERMIPAPLLRGNKIRKMAVGISNHFPGSEDGSLLPLAWWVAQPHTSPYPGADG
jgi:hypothetical protein